MLSNFLDEMRESLLSIHRIGIDDLIFEFIVGESLSLDNQGIRVFFFSGRYRRHFQRLLLLPPDSLAEHRTEYPSQ